MRQQFSASGDAAKHVELARRYGINVEEVSTDPPEFFRYLWIWFFELSSQRGHGFNLPDPLRYADIMAWAAISGNAIAAHELRLITEIDHIFLNEAAKARKAQEQAKARKRS